MTPTQFDSLKTDLTKILANQTVILERLHRVEHREIEIQAALRSMQEFEPITPDPVQGHPELPLDAESEEDAETLWAPLDADEHLTEKPIPAGVPTPTRPAPDGHRWAYIGDGSAHNTIDEGPTIKGHIAWSYIKSDLGWTYTGQTQINGGPEYHYFRAVPCDAVAGSTPA